MTKINGFRLGASVVWGLVLTSSNAFSVVGRAAKDVDQSDYPAVCRITITGTNDSEDVGSQICSGTLVASNKVLTAGHCFGRQFSLSDHNVSVDCGNSNASASRVDVPQSSSQWKSSQVPVSNSDYAILTLDSRLPVSVMPIAKNPGLYFSSGSSASRALQSGVHCQVLGFGKDNSGNTGSLHLASLDSLQTLLSATDTPGRGVLFPRNTIYASANGAELPVSVAEGDSGGPLLCQAVGRGWELVGINGRYLEDARHKKICDGFMGAWLAPVSNP